MFVYFPLSLQWVLHGKVNPVSVFIYALILSLGQYKKKERFHHSGLLCAVNAS